MGMESSRAHFTGTLAFLGHYYRYAQSKKLERDSSQRYRRVRGDYFHEPVALGPLTQHPSELLAILLKLNKLD